MMYKDIKLDNPTMELKGVLEDAVPFSEKREFNCTECCRNCEAEQCPYNETRCQ